MAIKVVTDSTSYIENSLIKELDITIVPLSVNFPDESFKENEVDHEYFYRKIKTTGIIPTSSQPSQGSIISIFENIVSNGNEIVAIFLSSDMSGTYETAISARDIVLEDYPHAKIEVLDGRTNSMALGLPVIEAARAALSGQKFDEIVDLAKYMIKRVHFYFAPETLEFLKKGGRIGGASALLGSILNIKPVLFVENGKTAVLKKARGSKAAIEAMLERLDNDYKTNGLKHILVHHINCHEKAKEIADKICDKYDFTVPVVPIGPVIGLHVGPGAIGIVYCTEK
ncbi:DegV family protein [Candidatus Syntrophocurvum alkaliphilum]|uniref:DegV family protein n=1 Tax=Candidatus Syntrophocurvum alkaliphilum TaxID=2293317 RepID=A0A6I6DGR9_9FIRM|nr:DegV family protein [Candidatus Syntrophocurvum alkaliphilum]QGT99580.1 DegV family protein [Candidatus Syntrophocurvum alkaliphilum]